MIDNPSSYNRSSALTWGDLPVGTQLGRWWLSHDRWTLGALILLIAVGILLNFAGTPLIAKKLGYPTYYLLQKQILFLVPSLALLLIVSMMPPLLVRTLCFLGLVVFIGALVATLLWGTEIKGARRWLSILGLSLQPSEFVKPLFAVVAAWLFAQSHASGDALGRWVASGICALIITLLILEPDLGMTFVIAITWFVQFFLAGLPLIYIGGLGILGTLGLVGAYLFLPHVTSRVDRFLDPSSGDSYQITKSLEAFTSGGLFGRGPGEGIIKAQLPDAHADFIFAVAGEEFGIIVCLGIVAIYGIICLRSLWRLYTQENLFIILAGTGLCLQFGVQAFVNMASSLHLIPTKGMTLPFLSYGGSSLLALSLGMGMLLAFTRHNRHKAP